MADQNGKGIRKGALFTCRPGPTWMFWSYLVLPQSLSRARKNLYISAIYQWWPYWSYLNHQLSFFLYKNTMSQPVFVFLVNYMKKGRASKKTADFKGVFAGPTWASR